MTRLIDRAGRTAAAARWLSGSLLLGACNVKQELLAPQNPGVIDPGSVANTAAADALYVGALGRWKASMNGGGNNTEALWNWQALFTDELQSGDTFSQRNDADSRSLQNNDQVLTPIYQAAQQARGRARDAINGLLAFDTSPLGKQHVGEMYLMMGYVEMELGESFCNGIPLGETVNGAPVYTQPLTDADVFKQALARLDTALTFLTATDAATVTIKQAVFTTRGPHQGRHRRFCRRGRRSVGDECPDDVPVQLRLHPDHVRQRMVDHGYEREALHTRRQPQHLGANPERDSVRAPQRPARQGPQFGRAGRRQRHDLHRPGELGSRRPDSAAVGRRCASDRGRSQAAGERHPGMMTILNAFRTSSSRSAFSSRRRMPRSPPRRSQAAATDLFFREKALWQFERGYRMGDLRRLVRQYGRTQDKVFPTGPFGRQATPSGTFGSQVAFPVPNHELNNPNFHGCLDLKA